MLKVRLIPVLLLKDKRMVKPIRFGAGGQRDVGDPVTTAKIYDSQDADELIFLDISASVVGRNFLLETLREVAKNCFVPLTAGGGIRTIDDIRQILRVGADKVSINTAAIENPFLIQRAAKKFGSQCITVSVDVRKVAGRYLVFTKGGQKATGLEVTNWAQKVVKLGAGEILLTSIDKEGTMQGYDLELVKIVTEGVSVPVVAHGGAGTRQDFVDVVKLGGASAVAAASVFHFSDSNLTQVKSFMQNSQIAVRPI